MVCAAPRADGIAFSGKPQRRGNRLMAVTIPLPDPPNVLAPRPRTHTVALWSVRSEGVGVKRKVRATNCKKAPRK